jgi:hypothetical protein
MAGSATPTTRRRLLDPILDGGIRNVNFFNGRLLTGTDLQDEQTANRQQRQQLGQAIGTGIAYGLEARLIADGADGQPPVVGVNGGLALNPTGQAVALPQAVEVALARASDPLPAEAGLFAVCDQPGSAAVSPGAGAYLLVIAPAAGYQERAPLRGFADGAVESCGSRYAVEGARFRLVALRPHGLDGVEGPLLAALQDLEPRTDAPSLAMLRNLLAHLCFGTPALAGFPLDPFAVPGGHSPYLAYGVADALRAAGELTACDVPIALVYWTAAGVQFLDMWAVRRRLAPPIVGDPWPLHVGSRRLAEAEATFLQFADQLGDLLRETNPAAIDALSHLRYLPAAGYLPIGPGEFTQATFFQKLTTDQAELDPATLRLLVQQSWFLDPIDLAAPPPIRLYQSPANPGYLLFVRAEQQPAPAPDQTTSLATGTGRITVDLRLDKRATTSFGEGGPGSGRGGIVEWVENERDIFLKAGADGDTVPIPAGALKVVAKDADGQTYPATYVRPYFSVADVRFGKGAAFVGGRARFRIANLPSGPYTVFVTLKGFQPASKGAMVQADQTAAVAFVLKPRTKTPPPKGEKPGQSRPGGWIKPGWYEKAVVVDRYPRWPWPPPEEVPQFQRVVDPPPDDVVTWLEDWAQWFAGEHPDAPVDPGDPQIVVDTTHTPDTMPANAYAYAVFGDGGAYLPLVLTPGGRSFERDVPLAKGGLAGVDSTAAEKLQVSGLGSLDVLAAGWAGLVADTLDVGDEAAAGVIGAAREQTEALQGSTQVFSGVDAALAAALAGQGFDSSVALANAEPQVLADQLGGAGITLAYARLLVDEARRAVPASEWSLSAPQLGLTDGAIAALSALGITSQRTFKAQAADANMKGQIAGALGVAAGQIDALAGAVALKSAAEIASERRGAAPVTGVIGANRETGLALANLGFNTVGKLAGANAANLAAAFGGNETLATAAINAAKTRIG